MTEVEILATGPAFLRAGARAFEPVIDETLRDAKSEIQVMMFVLTPKSLPLLNHLERAAARGIRMTIIVNSLKKQDAEVREKLQTLAGDYDFVKLVSFTDERGGQLHAKIVIVDRETALVGSANLTWGGLFSNYEIGLLVRGDTAWQMAQMVDRLASKLEQESRIRGKVGSDSQRA